MGDDLAFEELVELDRLMAKALAGPAGANMSRNTAEAWHRSAGVVRGLIFHRGRFPANEAGFARWRERVCDR